MDVWMGEQWGIERSAEALASRRGQSYGAIGPEIGRGTTADPPADPS